MNVDPVFERFADIPDPAAGLAGPVPAAPVPTEASPTRAQRRTRESLAVFGAVAWSAALAVAIGPRADVLSFAVIVPASLFAAGAAITLVLATRPTSRGMPPSVRRVQALLAFAAVIFLGFVAIGAEADVAGAEVSDGACIALTMLVALGPLALSAVALRRTFLTAPAWRGAALGAISGLVGAAGIHVHCPVVTHGHLLVAHGAPILIAIAVGAALGALRGRV